MREPHKRRSGYGPRVLFAKLGESKNQDHRSTQVQSLPKKGGDITETQVWPRVKHLGQKRELETMPKTTQYPKKEPRNLRKKWKKMEEIEERQKHSDPNSQFLQFPYDHKECRKTKGGSLRRRRRRRRRRRLRQERKSRCQKPFFPFLISSFFFSSSSLLPPLYAIVPSFASLPFDFFFILFGHYPLTFLSRLLPFFLFFLKKVSPLPTLPPPASSSSSSSSFFSSFSSEFLPLSSLF